MKNAFNKIELLFVLLILGACQNNNIQPVDLAILNAHVIDLESGETTQETKKI